ncbi:hypothetical protein [Streptomyces sp. NPDC006638]|uniref:hypothetical protein n=1 Tax=Streptomyces sp. NPDC006638 TaxID=3157183 RepID=UPI0033B48668
MSRRTQQIVGFAALAALLGAGLTACAADDQQPSCSGYQLGFDVSESKPTAPSSGKVRR